MAIVIGPCWKNFCSQKLKRRILATFGFNRTALRSTQPKLHSMFCSQKLKRRILTTFAFNMTALYVTQPKRHSMFCTLFGDCIISRRADVVWPPRSCDLTPLGYYLWGAVKDNCCADKSETIAALKDNSREAIGEIQLHNTIDNVPKNWKKCRLFREPFEWNYFPLLNGRIVLSNKKWNLRIYSVVFLKHFKKKVIGRTL